VNKFGKYIILVFILFGLICSSIGIGLLDKASVQAGTSLSQLDSSNWGYRQSFTVKGSPDGALTNYQMNLIVHKGSGTSTGSDVYLNNHCKDDFSDIRFIKSDGTTQLDYWIESYTDSNAIVWIEIDAIPASPSSANFYIYYGNPSALSASNGGNTFLFFDDFADNDYTSNLSWTVDSGKFSAANGYLEHTGDFEAIDIYSTSIFIPAGSPIMLEYDSMWTSTWCIMNWVGLKDSLVNTMLGGWGVHCDYSGLHGLGMTYNGSDTAQDYVYQGVTPSTWHHFREFFNGTAYGLDYDYGTNGFTIVSPAYANNIAKISIGGWQHQSGSRFDNLRVRKYIAHEPSLGTWGNEEHGVWGNDKLSGVQIGLLSFGLVFMLLGIIVLVKGRAKMLVIGAASVVEKVKRMPMRTKGLIILVAGAIVVIIAVILIFI
jgi:hypothetical protein